jgi:predicted Rossmann-fold nucleotide-binding protein
MMSPRILVCGGRDFDDYPFVAATLDRICAEKGWEYEPDEYGNTLPSVVVIQGGARGADACADQWAVTRWCSMIEIKADWDIWGKAAGPIRNQRMLEEKPVLVVAFPGGVGTKDMVERARRAGVEVMEITK